MSTLKQLGAMGQSFWIDFIQRELVTSGALQRMVHDDGLAGMTSNPAIFEQAIRQGPEYRGLLRDLVRRGVTDPVALYEQLAIGDVRLAADSLRSVYDATEGRDGYVSLEISPHLAHHTRESLREARRLWAAVDRPNLMLKIPGTPEGFPVVEALVREGINVNVTLLFSHEAYEAAAEAYLSALEHRARQKLDVRSVASVASFFVSRIDSAVDRLIEERSAETYGLDRLDLERVQGRVAVAWARLAYLRYKHVFVGPRWRELFHAGGRPQRIVWASTSTKNSRYRDVLYVEELIGPDTINTLPPSTIEAFRDHGRVASTLEQGLDEAAHVLSALERAGISMTDVTDGLLREGVRKFIEPYDALLKAIAGQRDALM
jgi:transaldolase